MLTGGEIRNVLREKCLSATWSTETQRSQMCRVDRFHLNYVFTYCFSFPYLDVRVDDEFIASPIPPLPNLNLGNGGQTPRGLLLLGVVPHKDDVILLTRWPFLYSSEVWHWNSKDFRETLKEFHCIMTPACLNAVSKLSIRKEFVKILQHQMARSNKQQTVLQKSLEEENCSPGEGNNGIEF